MSEVIEVKVPCAWGGLIDGGWYADGEFGSGEVRYLGRWVVRELQPRVEPHKKQGWTEATPVDRCAGFFHVGTVMSTTIHDGGD